MQADDALMVEKPPLFREKMAPHNLKNCKKLVLPILAYESECNEPIVVGESGVFYEKVG
jgi:hypothetical protein